MRFIIVCGLPVHGDINLKSYAKKHDTILHDDNQFNQVYCE